MPSSMNNTERKANSTSPCCGAPFVAATDLVRAENLLHFQTPAQKSKAVFQVSKRGWPHWQSPGLMLLRRETVPRLFCAKRATFHFVQSHAISAGQEGKDGINKECQNETSRPAHRRKRRGRPWTHPGAIDGSDPRSSHWRHYGDFGGICLKDCKQTIQRLT